jgi:uncharacterized NAD(P)/FAD-binding protein YdhS
MYTIAIIGGGFSGTMSAVNLARMSESPLRVCLINRGFPLGRGVAYSTQRPEHLLNVAARNMSALADHPNHLIDWLRTRSEYANVDEPTLRETFIPRRVYGDYLRSLLLTHARPLSKGATAVIDNIEDEAVDILLRDEGASVALSSGDSIEADGVLLATGIQPPAELSSTAEPLVHAHYCPSPWQEWESRLPEPHETVLLLGTGLTMVDAFLTLMARGWQGQIIAVSRHGLLPLSHFKGIEYPEFPPQDPSTLSLAALRQLIEEHCERLQQRGVNGAIVVDRLRPHTQRIWQHLSLAEKQEFCTQHSARWNVTRHRIAPQIHEQVAQALAGGRLRVIPGRIRSVESAGARVRVTFDDGSPEAKSLEAGLVINCTGPQTSFSRVKSPLFQNLLRRGMVQPDEMDMGLQVDTDFAVIDHEGNRSSRLFAIGPLLRGTLWETVAVPELRSQALRVAQTLLDEYASEDQKRDNWLVAADMEVLEYCI